MGSRNHPCCEKNLNQPSTVAAIQQSDATHPVFAVAALNVASLLLPVEFELRPVKFDSPFHSPPSLNSPLRI